MKFEWDENKNWSNFKKHGIWFEEAQTIGLMRNPSSSSIRIIVAVKIVSFESVIRREAE